MFGHAHKFGLVEGGTSLLRHERLSTLIVHRGTRIHLLQFATDKNLTTLLGAVVVSPAACCPRQSARPCLTSSQTARTALFVTLFLTNLHSIPA